MLVVRPELAAQSDGLLEVVAANLVELFPEAAYGEPLGEPETLRCCPMSEKAATGIGSRTTPTTCSRPLGASVPIIASQSSFTLTVLISRSKLPASFLIAAESLLAAT